MQTDSSSNIAEAPVATPVADDVAQENLTPALGQYLVIRRNGKVTSFDKTKIAVAMTKAFLAVEGSTAAASSSRGLSVDQKPPTVRSTTLTL